MRQIFNKIFKQKPANNQIAAEVQLKFQQALTLHQQDQLTQAQVLCEELLRAHPNHFYALNLLGVIALQTKNPQKALELVSKSIEISPQNAASYNNRGNALKELNQFESALASYDKAIAIEPNYAEAYRNRGIALRGLKQLDAAVSSYDKAITIKPDYAEAYYNRGNAQQELNQFESAVTSYNKAITINPDYVEAYNNCGLALQELKRLDVAVASYDKAITIKSDYVEAHCNRGLALQELKQLDAAVASYDKAIAIEPYFAKAYLNRGNALQELKQLDAAVASYDKTIAIEPDFAEAYCNRGNSLQKLTQLDAALASYDKAIAIEPNYAEAYCNRGNILQELEQLDAAVASYDKAIAIAPDYAGAHYNRGNTLQKLKQLDAALASYDKAIAIKPDFVDAYCNRGNILQELEQPDAALASYDKAIAIEPDLAEAYNNRGNSLQKLKQLDAALASYDKAIAIKPNSAAVYKNRGDVLQGLKHYQTAIESYDKALAIRPDYDFLFGMRLFVQRQICDWRNTESQLAELIQKNQLNEKTSSPFTILALSTSLPLQRNAAEIWVKEMHPANFELGETQKRTKGAKICLGYFSMDFRNHPVSYLTAELFETHDRKKFEIIAFSFGPYTQDGMRQRLEGSFDKFIDVRHKSDKEIAEMARLMEIDIAIDLAGHTADSRTNIFAMRAAPVQINFLGYPGTMGAAYIDYMIADKTLIPEESQQYYSEKIIYLPSFQPNDKNRNISDKVFTREEIGLPKSGFVFCCFNNSYKITPSAFDGWMRILKRVKGSVLWLSENNPTAVINLRKEAVQRGVNAQRLVFAERMPLLAEHLARYRAADLFVDTLPYNAHTTASDALWAGLPVLTCTSDAFASRVAASLLTAIDLPELITTTQEEYEALAVELATNTEQLNAIRQKLERNRSTTPLFDTKLFTKHIEDAYTQVYERYHADFPPDHIYVA